MPKETVKKKVTTKKAEPVAPVAVPIKKTAAKAAAPAPVSPPAPVKAKAEPAKKAPAKKAPAPKAEKPAVTKSSSAKTTIVAKFDAGFGNSLFLRGEGAGLGWDKGIEMTCVSSDEWSYTVDGASGPLAIKVLINDTTWSSGPNIEVPVGQTVVFTPMF